MLHEKLRSHVGVYLEQLDFEYMAGMTEIEICQTHYHLCALLSSLEDSQNFRFFL